MNPILVIGRFCPEQCSASCPAEDLLIDAHRQAQHKLLADSSDLSADLISHILDHSDAIPTSFLTRFMDLKQRVRARASLS